jgi:hypothetical protein
MKLKEFLGMENNVFQENLEEVKEESEKELINLKTFLLSYSLSTAHETLLLKYAPVILYSIWEGFFVQSIDLYLQAINEQELKPDVLNPEIKAHYFYSHKKLKLNSKREDTTKRNNFLDLFKELLSQKVYFEAEQNGKIINTKSNLTFVQMNKNLDELGLRQVQNKGFYYEGESKTERTNYKASLKKFMTDRGNAAHGSAIPLSQSALNEYHSLLRELFDAVFIIIYEAYTQQLYLKDNA